MRENFPLFLLPKNCEELVERLTLSPEEHELLGLEILYCEGVASKEKPDLRNLPYRYVKKYGGFKVVQMHKELMNKLGQYKDYVIQYSIANPESCFSLSASTDEEIIEFLKCADSNLPRTLDGAITQYEVLCKSIKVLQRMLHTENNKIPLYRTRFMNMGLGRSYWEVIGDGEKYAYRNNIHFNIVCDPRDEVFTPTDIYSYYFETEKKESEEEDYIKAKERYEAERPYYEENRDKYNKMPSPPPYMGTIYLTLNDRGHQLLDWYHSVGSDMEIFSETK